MNRAVMVIGVLSAIAVAGAGAAQAQPVPVPPPGPCKFTLSPPQVVQVAGVDQVTATLTPAECVAPFSPKYGVACIHIQGGEGRCVQSRGRDTAQVYFEPYRAGTTYVSSGRGCGGVFSDATDPFCQVLGPVNATL
jgi:hypothetical protein